MYAFHGDCPAASLDDSFDVPQIRRVDTGRVYPRNQMNSTSFETEKAEGSRRGVKGFVGES